MLFNDTNKEIGLGVGVLGGGGRIKRFVIGRNLFHPFMHKNFSLETCVHMLFFSAQRTCVNSFSAVVVCMRVVLVQVC